MDLVKEFEENVIQMDKNKAIVEQALDTPEEKQWFALLDEADAACRYFWEGECPSS